MMKEAHVTATMTRGFGAPPERVFDAWLDPRVASRWLFTSPEALIMKARRFEIDARVGGTWTIVNRMDGQEFLGTGEYLDIDRPRRLSFTFAIPEMSPTADRRTMASRPGHAVEQRKDRPQRGGRPLRRT